MNRIAKTDGLVDMTFFGCYLAVRSDICIAITAGGFPVEKRRQRIWMRMENMRAFNKVNRDPGMSHTGAGMLAVLALTACGAWHAACAADALTRADEDAPNGFAAVSGRYELERFAEGHP